MQFPSIKNKRVRIIVRVVISIFVLLLIVFPFIFTTSDNPYYKNTKYFATMAARLDSVKPVSTKSESFKVGWAKENITPERPIPLAGYGIRSDFESVHDSLWVRSFVIDNGLSKIAIITLDLLIFPPSITATVENRISRELKINHLYLSATHTHNGAGGWAEGLGQKFLAGSYDSTYVERIINSIVTSVKKAAKSVEEAEIGFAKYDLPFLIRNRLVKGDEIDPWLRVIKIKKFSGEIALITSFSAHPTSISSKINQISGDYPGALVKALETSGKTNFAAFLAGTVGSMAPREHGYKNFKLIDFISERLKNKILSRIDSINTKKPETLSFLKVELALPEPHLKVIPFFRLRPSIFHAVLGNYPSYIYTLKIDSLLMVGTPCDFSGTMTSEFDGIVNQKNLDLMITSFNGSYIGYVTPKQYSQVNKSETKEMNWYGSFTSAYFVDIIKSIIEKF